jgi:hypothetical protein
MPMGSIYVKGMIDQARVAESTGRVIWMRSGSTGRVAVGAMLSVGGGAREVRYQNTAFVAKLAATPPPAGSPAGTLPTYAWRWVAPVVSNVRADTSNNITAVDQGSSVNGIFFGTTTGNVTGMAAGANGSIYLTGSWVGNNVAGGGNVASRTTRDGYIARLRGTDGASLYLSTYDGERAASQVTPGSIVTDLQGNVFVTGAAMNTDRVQGRQGTTTAVPIGLGDVAYPNFGNLFVAKLAADGRWIWGKSTAPVWFDSQVSATASGLARDSAGALYVGGAVRGLANYEGFSFDGTLVNATEFNGANNAFIAKLVENSTANGASWQWVLQTQATRQGSTVTPIFDVGDIEAGLGGTIYWSLCSLTPSGLSAFSPNRSSSGGDSELDFTREGGAYLMPILPDVPALSPTFSIFNTAICGQEVPPPGGVARDSSGKPLQPDVTLPSSTVAAGPDKFYWDGFEKKLYAVSPTVADIKWRVSLDATDPQRLTRRISTSWPTTAQGLVTAVVGAGANSNEPAVSLEPVTLSHTFNALLYQDNDGQVAGAKQFTARKEGYAVLLYTTGRNSAAGSAAVSLTVVRTLLWTNSAITSTSTAAIGSALSGAAFNHADPEGRNGYVVNRQSRIDALGASGSYQFATRLGPIIPVNEDEEGADDDLNVIWSRLDAKGVSWPARTVRYTASWPTGPERIVIASRLGSEVYAQEPLDPAKYQSVTIYHQPDKTLPGYNPNEEHATLQPGQVTSNVAVFALRADLNNVGRTTSKPYTLLRYHDPNDGLRPKFRVFQIFTESSRRTVNSVTYPAYAFDSYTGVAGNPVFPPYPLPLLGTAAGTSGSGVPYFKDRKNQVWARAAGELTGRYFYPLQPSFWYDMNGDGVQDAGVTEVPWLDRYNSLLGAVSFGVPVPVVYNITWPVNTPALGVGDTLTTARDGLPDVENMASATIIYDQANAGNLTNANATSVRLLDYSDERKAPLNGVVDGQSLVVGALNFQVELASGGRYRFSNLPFHLKSRLTFDAFNKQLIFGGYKNSDGAGRPLLLLNILSTQERDRLFSLDGTPGDSGSAWDAAVLTLYRTSRNPEGVDLDSTPGADDAFFAGFKQGSGGALQYADALGSKALTAGRAGGVGYVTIVQNNADGLGAAPIDLKVIRVVNPPAVGDLKVIFSDNALDEKITIRHGLDFAGDAGGLAFEWWIQPALTATSPPAPDPLNPASGGWTLLASGNGVNDVVIEGAGLRTLADSWIFCRYRGYTAGGHNPNVFGDWAGDPAGTPSARRAAFVPGWIKRVLEGINPFEARVKDFGTAPTQTYSSFLISAGPRYEGDVALSSDPGNLNNIGLISLYQTVLNRGFGLSINGTPSQTNDAVNNALLLAATRISDFYMLLGNEAYADAQDPTVGFTTTDGAVGSLAPSIFAFQNQLPSLISEELTLLRGRDNASAGVGALPVYNRLFWNFTNGLEGEPAYVQNYGITDQTADGLINETDARFQFPQGHGDAWGHYLMSVKSHYRLLRHPLFTWQPRTESTLIAGVAVEVDYLDERRFAKRQRRSPLQARKS